MPSRGTRAECDAPNGTVCFGPFEFHPRSRELRKHGLRIKLQGQPVEVLLMLLERPGDVVTRQEIQERLWAADTFVDFEHSLNAAVKRLRAALGDSPQAPRFIETLAGRGYRFIAPVSRPAEVVAPPVGEEPLATGRRRFVIWTAVISAVVLAAVIGMYSAAVGDGFRISGAPPPIRSLAVLPLANLSGDPDQDYFVDGMTDALREHLEGISSLRVVSRTSSAYYRGRSRPLPDIARELRVDAVVDGSVLRSGNRVRISVELVQAASDKRVWSRSYDGDLRDIFSLQAGVARTIADEIRVELTPPDRARLARRRLPPISMPIRRIPKGGSSGTSEPKPISRKRSVSSRRPSTRIRTTHLPTMGWRIAGSRWAGTATCRHRRFPNAKAAVTRALSLDDSLAEAHTSLAFVKLYYDRDWESAGQEFRRAIDLNPNYANGHHWYAEYLTLLGRHSEAIAESERARELDPLSTIINTWVGSRYFFARQYDRAIQEYRNALEMDPDFVPAHMVLGQAYEQKGMLPEAIAEPREPLRRPAAVPSTLPRWPMRWESPAGAVKHSTFWTV